MRTIECSSKSLPAVDQYLTDGRLLCQNDRPSTAIKAREPVLQMPLGYTLEPATITWRSSGTKEANRRLRSSTILNAFNIYVLFPTRKYQPVWIRLQNSIVRMKTKALFKCMNKRGFIKIDKTQLLSSYQLEQIFRRPQIVVGLKQHLLTTN